MLYNLNHDVLQNSCFFLDAALVVVSFKADATEGLQYIHSVGVINCDHNLDNTLMCHSDGPMGFVGKVTEPTQRIMW